MLLYPKFWNLNNHSNFLTITFVKCYILFEECCLCDDTILLQMLTFLLRKRKLYCIHNWVWRKSLPPYFLKFSTILEFYKKFHSILTSINCMSWSSPILILFLALLCLLPWFNGQHIDFCNRCFDFFLLAFHCSSSSSSSSQNWEEAQIIC